MHLFVETQPLAIEGDRGVNVIDEVAVLTVAIGAPLAHTNT